MRWILPMACILFLFGGAMSALAQEQTADDEVAIGEITVQASGETEEGGVVPREVIESGRFTNMSEAVTEVPGVSAVKRSASSAEPVIRGAGWERVATQMNGLPLYGACPSRMDPPMTYIRSHTPEKMQIIKGLPSVTLGPGGTGGRILVSTDYERSAEAPPELGGWLKAGGESNREGKAGEFGVKGGNRWVDAKAAFEILDYSDYETGGGDKVPASQEGYSGALSLGARPAEGHRWSNYINYVREEDVDYPSLPMDIDETDFWVYTTGYRIRPENEVLEELNLSFGLQNIDHTMSNRRKPNRIMQQAETPSDSDNYSASAKLTFNLTPGIDLVTGADIYYLERDATRTRFLPMTNQTFEDRIWPDATQWDIGGFAEVQAKVQESLSLRVGGRVDFVSSDADAVDARSLMMRTVREQYVRFYGEDAADVEEEETLGSGNIVLTWKAADGIETHIGAGVTMRPAGVTERYFAFAPAPGGFLVGNPTLDPERKYELEWGVDVKKRWFDFSFSLFHNWVDDYILQTQIDRFDVNNDGTPDVVKGFRNVDARLYGFEAGLLLKAGDHWSLPFTAAFVRGKNSSDDRDLPEIPPLELTGAVRADYGIDHPWWVEFGGRFADRQKKVDEAFPEDETGSFAVFHLRGGVTLREALKVELGIENLFDRDYNEHLTREAFLAEGDLEAGDEIPAPGITFYASVRWEF
ncbi:MAG: TonB-dependent receptor domain-containing protein [Desulfobacterales bacterium]